MPQEVRLQIGLFTLLYINYMKRLLIFLLLTLPFIVNGQSLIDPATAVSTKKVNEALQASVTASGTNTYTGTLYNTGIASTGITTYTNLCIDVTFTNGNTGASTFNLNGIGARTIKKFSAGNLVDIIANDIGNGETKRLKDNGTYLVILGGVGTITSVSGTANQIASTGGTTPVISIVTNPILPGAPTIVSPGNSTQNIITTDATQTLSNKTLVAPELTGIPSAPTAASGTNTTQIATTNFANNNPTSAELGSIISDSFTRSDAATPGSNWTVTGTAAFSIVSNKLQITSSPGSVALTNYMAWNAYGNSNLECVTQEATFTAGTISSTNFGVGFTFQSAILANTGFHVQVSLVTGSTGKITFYKDNVTTGSTTSPNGITISAADVFTVRVKLLRHKMICIVSNVTTGTMNSFEVDRNYDYSSTTSALEQARLYGIMNYGSGGANNLADNYVVTANDHIGADFCILGDSMTKGIFADNINNTWAGRLNQLSDSYFLTNAGSSGKIQDINTNEVIALAPKKILISVGFNNIPVDATGTIATRFSTIVSTFQGAGYVLGTSLFIDLLPPNNTITNNANITTVNTALISTYGTACIDIYSPLANGAAMRYSSDAIHPDPEGHKIWANTVYNFLNLKPKLKGFESLNSLYYNANGYINVSPRNATNVAISPAHALDVYDPNNLGIRVKGSTTVDGGLFMGSVGTANGLILAGYDYAGGFISKATANSGIFFNTEFVNLYANTGATVGAGFTPASRIFYSTAGVGIMGITTPTAKLHINLSTGAANTAGVKFAPSSTLLTVVEANTIESNNAFYVSSNALNRLAVSGKITGFTTAVSNTSTTETDLFTYTTKASTLAATDEEIEFTGYGTLNDLTATNQIQFYFAGTLIGNTGALTVSAIGGFKWEVSVKRTGTTTASAGVSVSTPGASTATYTNQTDLTGLTFTNTNIVKITGTASGASGGTGDITAKHGKVIWMPATSNP